MTLFKKTEETPIKTFNRIVEAAAQKARDGHTAAAEERLRAADALAAKMTPASRLLEKGYIKVLQAALQSAKYDATHGLNSSIDQSLAIVDKVAAKLKRPRNKKKVEDGLLKLLKAALKETEYDATHGYKFSMEPAVELAEKIAKRLASGNHLDDGLAKVHSAVLGVAEKDVAAHGAKSNIEIPLEIAEKIKAKVSPAKRKDLKDLTGVLNAAFKSVERNVVRNDRVRARADVRFAAEIRNKMSPS